MAKLKALIKSLDEVDEKYRDLYEQTDDGYMLVLDDKDVRRQLDEFRTNNRTLKKQTDDLQKQLERYRDIDPEKYKTALAAWEKLQQSEEAKLIADGKLDEVLAKRTKEMQQHYSSQIEAKSKALAELQQERDAFRQKLSAITIDQEVQKAVANVGSVRKGAFTDILNRARSTFTLDEQGNVIARRGNEPIYGKDGDPLKLEDWAKGLIDEAPYLFEASSGGGAGGGKRGDGDGGRRVVSRHDKRAISANLEKIARGELVVGE